jgi:hypothetical protein
MKNVSPQLFKNNTLLEISFRATAELRPGLAYLFLFEKTIPMRF